MSNKSQVALRDLLQKLEPRHEILRNALLGNGDGSTVLTGNTNEVYVRLPGPQSRVVRALNLNSAVTPKYGIAVDVEVLRHQGDSRGERAIYRILRQADSIMHAGIGPPSAHEYLLASVAGVNMNTATATSLFTVPTGRSCIITRVVVRNASVSLTTASYSFGFNSAAYNDVIANATHVELTGNTLYTVLSAMAGAKVGVAAGVFTVLMNTLQGAAATTTMEVFGYLI